MQSDPPARGGGGSDEPPCNLISDTGVGHCRFTPSTPVNRSGSHLESF